MALQFILGGAGSGKTWYLNHALVRKAKLSPERRFVVIVPEQFTMETQKALVEIHPGHCILNIDVLSFERLAYRVFEDLGCMPQTVLDDMGKSMLIRKACAGMEKELEIYRRHLSGAGFMEQLKSLMSEFGQYRIGPEELDRLILETENRPLLNGKLKDIRVLSGAFHEAMDEGMITAEELLAMLTRVLPEDTQLNGTSFWFDGFTGFSPAQYEVVRELMKLSEDVTVSVTIRPDAEPHNAAKESDLFALSRRTIAALTRMAKELEIPVLPDLIPGREAVTETAPERMVCAELSYLEKHLFQRNCRGWEKVPEHICLYRARTPEEETGEAVRRILALVKSGRCRYREIAVICGDLTEYLPYLEKHMKEAGIPCFMDHKRSLFNNPVVAYLRAALEIIEKDFPYESVFRYLKCGFLPVSQETIYEMENYVLALGIRGRKKWSEPWTRMYQGGEHVNLEALNEARRQVAEPLLVLRDGMKGKNKTAREMTEALFHWLDAQQAEQRLSAMAEAFAEAGEYSLQKEYEQAYGQLLELFDRVVGLLGEEVVSLPVFNDILETGCREIRVGVIPAAMDRVFVGDMERSRLKDIKALFFIGVNDGNVPAPAGQGGLLSELDREALSSLTTLTPTRRAQSLINQFYFYLTLSKPAEHLCISYAMSAENGNDRLPSSYLGYLRRVFPLLSAEDLPEEKTPDTKAAALAVLAAGMEAYKNGEGSGAWQVLYQYFCKKGEEKELLSKLVDAAFFCYGGDSLSRAAAKALYGEILTGSVTRLEKYAACAYAQFLSYGLRLLRRRELEFAVLDMGTIFHKAIELSFRYAAEAGKKLEELTASERAALAQKTVREAAEQGGSAALDDSARNRHLVERMVKTTQQTLWALGKQLEAGEMEPSEFEIPFDARSNPAMQILLEDGSRMELKGKIDRLDLYEDEEHVYVKIVDYKSGSAMFDLNSVYYGLQLQLVLYLDAVMLREQEKHPEKEIVPAGMFYYRIQDPILEREAAADRESAFLMALRPAGPYNGDPEVRMLMDRTELGEGDSLVIPATGRKRGKDEAISAEQFKSLRRLARKRIREFGLEIEKGRISAEPYRKKDKTGCDYCEFRQVCGFDTRLDGYQFRRLPEKKPEEIWEELKEGNADGSNVD